MADAAESKRALVPALSVVFSFRNEESVIPELIKRTRAVLDGERRKGVIQGWELVFVDDDSKDASEKTLMALAEGHGDIRIVTMSRCYGGSPCALAGMEYSTGDLVVYMDTDLQDPPEVIPRMLEAWRAGDNVDVVHTRRLSRGGESAVKLFSTKVGYHILRSVASVDLPIESGDFKLLTRRAVKHLVQLKEKNPYLRGMVHWIGFNQVSVPYHREARHSGETKFPALGWRVLANFFESAVISFSLKPLYLAGFMGLFAAFTGFLVLANTLVEYIRGHNIPGWTAIMVAVLFLGSFQLLSLGVIGLYLGNVMLEVKGRPNYIVKKLFGFDQNTA